MPESNEAAVWGDIDMLGPISNSSGATDKARSILGIFLFSALTGACSSADEDGPCAERSGTYRVTYSERSGSCGPLTEVILTLDAQPLAPEPPCTGEVRYSEDNCEVTNVNIACPEPGVGAGAYSVANGKYEWSTSGGSGTGSLNLRLYDANDALLCQSTYTASATRI